TTTHIAESSLSAPEVLRTDVTSAYAGFAVLGQNAEGLVSRLTAFDVSPRSFPQGSCVETEMAAARALLAGPPRGRLTHLHVYIGWDVGEYIWEQLLRAGHDLGALPVGLEALASAGVRPDS